jgi:AhpD family alkylhydroperoxidase
MKNTKTFNKRTYHNLGEIIKDTRAIFARQKGIKPLMRGEIISDSFRERIMLAVTEVNGCRYCQYAHAKMAIDAGLSPSEIEDLSAGALHNCPSDEIPALLYAQHWAESDGSPDPDTRQEITSFYGEQKVDAMELAMRMIRMGNLMGNTWDYFLYKISFGRWGNE